MSVKCRTCEREIHTGENAWASEWRVIDVASTTSAFRTETRYECDECDGKR